MSVWRIRYSTSVTLDNRHGPRCGHIDRVADFPDRGAQASYNLSSMNTGFVDIGSTGGMLVRALLRSRALAVETNRLEQTA